MIFLRREENCLMWIKLMKWILLALFFLPLLWFCSAFFKLFFADIFLANSLNGTRIYVLLKINMRICIIADNHLHISTQMPVIPFSFNFFNFFIVFALLCFLNYVSLFTLRIENTTVRPNVIKGQSKHAAVTRERASTSTRLPFSFLK